MPELTPPDHKQCQAEMPNGNSYMTLGGRVDMVRCKNKPTVIAVENTPDKDGVVGSMALCDSCKEVFIRQMGKDFASFTPLKSKAKIKRKISSLKKEISKLEKQL